MVAALISFIFYNQHLDQDGVMNINGALFMCISNMTFQNVLAVTNVSMSVAFASATLMTLPTSEPNLDDVTTGVLFRTARVHARALQRHVSDRRILLEQDFCRVANIFGYSCTVYIHHVLHCRPEP